jgi:uncharacterized membrane protein
MYLLIGLICGIITFVGGLIYCVFNREIVTEKFKLRSTINGTGPPFVIMVPIFSLILGGVVTLTWPPFIIIGILCLIPKFRKNFFR